MQEEAPTSEIPIVTSDANKDRTTEREMETREIQPGDAEWPAWLDRMPQPPKRLYVRGEARLNELAARSVAVVGARAATGYGEWIAADWSYSLAQDGWTVISGAGYGIDGAANRGALAANGPTVAVLGCGLDIGHPAGHDILLRNIADTGLLVSEYPDGVPPARHRLLDRNRIIAALGLGLVVVEAVVRGGSLNMAARASELKRPVMAVPGPITSRTSQASHDLIRNGQAELVDSADAVASVLHRSEVSR